MSKVDKKSTDSILVEDSQGRSSISDYTLMQSEVELNGPMFVDPERKDPNFYYRWVNYNTKRPYRLQARLKLGYQFCTIDEFPNLMENTIAGLTGASEEGDKIFIVVDEHTRAYLMKQPMHLYMRRQALKEQRRKDAQRVKEHSVGGQFGLRNL